MPNASFVQTDFRGGYWSKSSWGKMTDRRYKTALAQSTNGMPLFNGPWAKRPGFVWGGNTKAGKPARLLDCYLKFSEPFQLELSDGIMRVHVGSGFVYTPDSGVTISAISTAKPAVVTVNGALPAAWANFDTVVLNMNTTLVLSGRQFTIQVLSSTTFSLYDALTGLPVDGSTFTYTQTRNGADRVYKILELATPWPLASIDGVRLVRTDANAVLMHSGAQPQALTVPPAGNFALNPLSFLDGPYLDINTTTTTATPNALSGSVTFTFSSVTGINAGGGFQTTDVGRCFRFQSGPPVWASGTTYANAAIVLGSDNNIYQSVIGANVGNDPTTDNGVHWVITGQTVIWVWGYITVVNSTTSITVAIQPAAVVNRSAAQIPGDVLTSTSASTAWALGLYSNTTGWPAGGCYHEGRLYLFGSMVTNRWDASQSNAVFNFAPTAPDGTLGDGSAMAEEGNADEINAIFWMLSGAEGVLVGTQSGEWLIFASALGDPITWSVVQFKRKSQYGSANVEPQITELTTCFVQREQQRVLNYAHYPYGESAGWFAKNLSEDANDLFNPGIAEIRWQQEPSHWLWARTNAGGLLCSTFEHAAYGEESYNGWHNHNLTGGRTVRSISTGPSSDGLSTTLYVIAYNPTTTYYEYLELSHLFDGTVAPNNFNFTDGIAEPTYALAGPSGVTIYGLYNVIGEMISVEIGGLDLGDFTVQGPFGSVFVAYAGLFNSTFLANLATGANFGVNSITVQPNDTNTYTSYGFGAYSPSNTNLLAPSGTPGLIAMAENNLVAGSQDGWMIVLQRNSPGLRIYDLSTFVEYKNATSAQIGWGGKYSIQTYTNTFCYHPGNNCVFCCVGSSAGVSNNEPIGRIDMSTLRLSGTFGIEQNLNTGFQFGFGYTANTIIPLRWGSRNFVATVFQQGVNNFNNVGVIDGDTMQFVGTATVSPFGSFNNLFLVPGPFDLQGFGNPTFYGVAQPVTLPTTSSLAIYSFTLLYGAQVDGIGESFYELLPAIQTTNTGNLAPSAVDATWTHFNTISAPAYDQTDGNLIFYVSTNDSVTHTAYIVKVKLNGTVVWATPFTGTWPFDNNTAPKLELTNGVVQFANNNTIYNLNTNSGAITTDSGYPTSMSPGIGQLYWPTKQAIICSDAGATFTGSPPGPYDSGTLIPLGAYMLANNQTTAFGMVSLVTKNAPATSANWPPPSFYSIPASIGQTYTAVGQLLRPDQGQDAGAAAGPAFGKKRRQHWYAISLVNSQNFNISTDGTFAGYAGDVDTVTVHDEDENVISQPNLFTGTISDTMPDDYSFDSQLAWQSTRPLPLTITAIGGYIATQDK